MEKKREGAQLKEMIEIKEVNNILYRIQKDWPIEGVNFVDLTPSLNDADKFYEICLNLKKKILAKCGDIDYIVSPDARGFIWGSYLAALMHKPLIPVRKQGKIPDSFVMAKTSDTTEYSHIDLVLPQVDITGKRCIFVDDVYATGGTYKACQKLIEQEHGLLADAFVILNILLTDDEINYLVSIDDLDLN